MIPEAAVEAGWEQARSDSDGYPYPEREEIHAILEAAAPHMLSHERQQTADAHRDAIVNARTVDKLNAAIEAVLAMTCKPNSNAVPHNQPDLVPPWYSDRIRAAITEALSK